MKARKYNPGFLSDEDLIASFCVRMNEFRLLTEVLRECEGSSNPHQLVIGSRGSGKTSLLLRLAAEVRRDSLLADRFFPVVFAEESYEVATAGEFWLECLIRLAMQAPREENGTDLDQTVAELRSVAGRPGSGRPLFGLVVGFRGPGGEALGPAGREPEHADRGNDGCG